MEALNFLRFWKPNISELESIFLEGEDGEDSLFDLNIISPPGLCCKNGGEPNDKASKQSNGVSSKRKILPIEYSFRPQSPIALLKSAPKLSIFVFKRQKSTAAREIDDLDRGKSPEEEHESFPFKYYGETSSRKREISSLKPKYFNVIKFLNPKFWKKSIEKNIFTDEFSAASPVATLSVSSPAKEKQGNILGSTREICRHLGKSKSASASSSGTISVQHRKDDSFWQYQDGIQSAILHCKRSLNSSNDSSMLKPKEDDSRIREES